MTNVTPGDGRLSKNEKREAAREKARILRIEQKKKERRTKVLLQGGIILASLAIVAVIALVIVNSVRPVGPGPANMASDGVQISEGFIATETPALKSDEAPVPNKRDEASGILDIQIYLDYQCPNCGDFEKTNADYITSLVENGKTTVEYHPISFLDRASGTKFSTRAANAAACVANYSPNQFYAFNALMFDNQPAENTPGLDDAKLIELTTEAKVESAASISTCINELEFKAWVGAATARALNGPIPNSNIEKIPGTPTVIVNGLKYEGSITDLASFQAFVLQATGADFNEQSTPTPTPTPSETPTP